MASVFGDESADETMQRVFAVAALEGSEPEWQALEEKWVARTGGREFHATECESQYANDPDPQKHKDNLLLYADLTQLVVNSDLRGYGVAMDLAGYREFFPDVLEDFTYIKCFTEVLKYFIPNSLSGNFKLGKADVAAASATKALAMDPLHTAPNTEQLLAVILAGKGDYAGALQHLRNCLTYVPAGPNADLIKQQIAQLETAVPAPK